jgi:perosamine synthetase
MIPLFKVHVPRNIGSTLQAVFDTGMITEGTYSDEFEHQLSKCFKAPTSIVNSCTSALTLAYRASGVEPGTEVISTPMTCMATNEPIHTMGAKIVWADIDPSTGNIAPASVAQRLTPNTRAVVGVHWAGAPFDVAGVYAVLRTAGRHDVKVIADAAHAFGASYLYSPVGSECDHVCFSFQAIKHLTTVDGGAVTSKDPGVDALIKRLRWFGLDRKYSGDKWSQDITHSGYKFHMNNINAAIGLEQLKSVDNIVTAHQNNGEYYNTHIFNAHVTKLWHDPRSRSAHWIYTLLVDDREAFKKHMAMCEVACDVVHHRNDKYSVFKEFARDDLPGVDEFCAHMINIPVGWWLTALDRDHIVEAVNSYVT